MTMESIQFTKQADGWWKGTLTVEGQNTLVQLDRKPEADGNNLVVLASMDGLPPAIYKVFDGMTDAKLLLDIELPKGTAVTLRSKSEVLSAFCGSSNKLIEKTITANGTYEASKEGAEGYSKVTVNAASRMMQKDIYNNGEYNPSQDGVDGYSYVRVNVQAQLAWKTITEDGTYHAQDEGYDGYNHVSVDTSSQLTTKTITANGTYNAQDDGKKGYSQVTVNVPIPVVDNRDYLYFEAIDTNVTIGLSPTSSSLSRPVLFYSLDDKNSWQEFKTSVGITPGNRVYFYGNNTRIGQAIGFYWKFTTSGLVKCGGNVMTLLSREDELTSITTSCCFMGLFNGTNITTAPKLPATTLGSYCYANMFQGCKYLTTAPALPATTLAEYCYSSMFFGCTSLVSAPALPATTLARSCYESMFRDCTLLISAPTLPAPTLDSYCYYMMFYGCTSLTIAPIMLMSVLVLSCLASMFGGCTSLKNVMLPNLLYSFDWSTNNASNWLSNVAANGTVCCKQDLNIPSDSTSGIPTGWTRVDI